MGLWWAEFTLETPIYKKMHRIQKVLFVCHFRTNEQEKFQCVFIPFKFRTMEQLYFKAFPCCVKSDTYMSWACSTHQQYRLRRAQEGQVHGS